MSIVYNGYMKLNYTVEDFRKHLRQAFNEADNGREVIITRYGQPYRLISQPVRDDDGSYIAAGVIDEVEDDGTPIEPVVGTLEDLLTPEERNDYKKCKNGHLYRGDKCIQKECL